MPLSHFRNLNLIAMVALIASASAEAAPPVKVFILAGQSNMEGQGRVEAMDASGRERPGTLTALLTDPKKARMLRSLRSRNGQWAAGCDVWIYDINESGTRHGDLDFGYGWDLGNKHWFGPELQFGRVIRRTTKSQVLIIKTAWGGKSLYADFRPPSSGGTVGPYYLQMVSTVRAVLNHLKEEFPAYAGQGYELDGFVWWHGWNDYCGPKIAVEDYGTNLANLIRDLRRDLDAPELPVVIGEFTGPWGADCHDAAALAIRNEEAAVAMLPAMRRTVRFVKTHDFVRTAAESPSDQTYHEFQNGETYFLIGDALGKSMAGLLHHLPKSREQART